MRSRPAKPVVKKKEPKGRSPAQMRVIEEGRERARIERERRREENRADWAERRHLAQLEAAERKSAERVSDLMELKEQVSGQLSELAKSLDEGAAILGENFPNLMQKHVDLALQDSRDAIAARQFLIRHFSTLVPDSTQSLSQNDALMAKGLEAIKSGKARLVERSIEMVQEDEPNRVDFDPRYDVEYEDIDDSG